jgi:hypothetical protein
VPLVDEISQEPRHEFRLPPGPPRWLTAIAVACLIAAFAAFGITRLGGPHGGRAASVSTATAAPTAAPNPQPDIQASVLPYIVVEPMMPGASLSPVTSAPQVASPAHRHHTTRHAPAAGSARS